MKTIKLVLAVSLTMNVLLGVFIWKKQMLRPPMVSSPSDEAWAGDWQETILPLPARRIGPLEPPESPLLQTWTPKEIEYTDPTNRDQFNDTDRRFNMDHQRLPRSLFRDPYRLWIEL